MAVETPDEPRWKHDGVRVIKGDQLDPNTAQTPGMFRQAVINHARAQHRWKDGAGRAVNAKRAPPIWRRRQVLHSLRNGATARG